MRLSYSSTSTYVSCGFKYFLHYYRKLRPIKVKSAFLFGDAIDQGLNYLLNDRMDIEGAIKQFHDTWAKHKDGDIKYSKSDMEEHILPDIQFKNENEKYWYSLDIKGEILIKEYFEQIIPKLHKIIAVQIEDKIINNDGDEFIIKADFIAEYNGRVILFDNKTSSVRYEADSVKNSAQLATYFEALKDKYKLDAAGYIVIPKKINKKKKPIVDIKVIIDNVSEETIEKTFQEYDTVLNSVKAAEFTKNHNSCISKYGRCEYYEYCHNNDLTGLEEKNDQKIYNKK